jgi:hypothetical protein
VARIVSHLPSAVHQTHTQTHTTFCPLRGVQLAEKEKALASVAAALTEAESHVRQMAAQVVAGKAQLEREQQHLSAQVEYDGVLPWLLPASHVWAQRPLVPHLSSCTLFL